MRPVILSLALSSALSALGCAGPAPAPAGAAAHALRDDGAPLDVSFAGCREVANVGLMPTANARPLAPAQFTLAGDGTPQTPFVVRSVHCDAISFPSTDDGDGGGRPGDLIQVGFVIVAPDGDGDINNYTLYYDTSDPRLAKRLADAGVPTRHVPTLSESLTVNADGSGAYSFSVPPSYDPALTFAGPVGAPTGGPIPFVANWWSSSAAGTVKMNSTFPQLFIADNDVMLMLPAGSALAGVLGATTVSEWPVLKLFDDFPSAAMHVTVR